AMMGPSGNSPPKAPAATVSSFPAADAPVLADVADTRRLCLRLGPAETTAGISVLLAMTPTPVSPATGAAVFAIPSAGSFWVVAASSIASGAGAGVSSATAEAEGPLSCFPPSPSIPDGAFADVAAGLTAASVLGSPLGLGLELGAGL
ncbi:hypothetical protein Vretifemale_407, partial [Volvox reticuliferus]